MADSPRRALLFAPYFLPRRRVGSMRPFRFALHLSEFGWQPTVLSIEAKGQQLTDKEARLLADVENVTLSPPFDRSTSAESQLGLASDTDGPPLGQDLLDWFDRQFPVDTWLLLFAITYPQIVRTIRRVQPHVLWSTGDPWSSLVVARHLSQRFDIPWVADFRDPWTLSGVRGAKKSRLTRAVNRWCERRIVETADVVLFQSTENEKKYHRHYADLDMRTTTIYNSYDPEVFDDPVCSSDDYEAPPPSTASHLDIGFFGRFRAMSPAGPMADALRAVRERHGASAAEAIHVHSFGPLNKADERYAEEHGVRDSFQRREAVPLERALSALRQFDLLLVSTSPKRDEIIPAKLLEYLAAGRPILSLSPNPEVGRILKRTGTGMQLPLDEHDAIADVLVDCLEARRSGEPLPVPFAPDEGEIRHFAARPTTQELAALFDSIAHAPSF